MYRESLGQKNLRPQVGVQNHYITTNRGLLLIRRRMAVQSLDGTVKEVQNCTNALVLHRHVIRGPCIALRDMINCRAWRQTGVVARNPLSIIHVSDR